MKDVTNARGLTNLRTATTRHLHATPPQHGTEYLSLYLLGKETQRLEQELTRLQQRQKLILIHLGEIRQAMDALEKGVRQDDATEASCPGEPADENALACWNSHPRQWRKMTIPY